MQVQQYIMAENIDQDDGVTGALSHFNSVGIDIGSTTTQLVFSKLSLGFVEETHKFDIVDREVTHLSEICLTPFHDNYTIDTERLRKILGDAYRGAGFEADDIDTGAIIITGVAALRHNAARILELFSNQMGRFVVATAGPNYEAILAAHGSGAVGLSDRQLKTVMNVDVGGGTTKIAVVRKGEVVYTASIYVGARHVILDDGGRAVRVEEPAEIVASANGFGVTVGDVISEEEQLALASSLADSLFELIRGGPLSPLTEKLMQTPPIGFEGRIDVVFFSGGVSEYVYRYEKRSFGDIGLLLGEEIRKRMCDLPVAVKEPMERSRATVICESQYTLQVSGTTNLISDLGLLPVRNLPVVTPQFSSSVLSVEQMETEIQRALGMHDLDPSRDSFALAFARSVINQPSYLQMKGLSEAVVSVQREKLKAGSPLVLVFEADIGMGIGRVIQEEVATGCALISIDEIKLSDFNYVDIGEPTGDRGLIPVIIKSLVFQNQF
jgi:ethanolamine utilization protein EutA